MAKKEKGTRQKKKKGRSTGCTANSVMQVTAEPATVAVSVNHVNHTHACIEKTGKFAVSILQNLRSL